MRSGTLVLVIAANAIIAVGVVAVALTAFPPTPAAESPETNGREVASAAPAEDIQELKALVQTQGDLIRQMSRDLTDAREKVAALESRSAGTGPAPSPDAADAAGASPEDSREAASREAMKAMARGMAVASRQMGRRILEGLANPTDESIRQAEGRVRGEAQRLGRRLNLSGDRVAQVEQAFLDVDRRTREKMRVAINDKGIDNVTYEDAKPLVEESFQERERAMESVLTPEEMEGFKAQNQQARTFVEMGMRMAFPSKTETEGEGR